MSLPGVRRWALLVGIAILLVTWAGPLPAQVPASFAAHMAMHVLVVAVAAPLLALGVAGSSWDPVVHHEKYFAPLPAALLELVVIWSWHAPALHEAARGVTLALIIKQSSFLLVALLVWLSAFGGHPALRRRRAAAGVVGLLLTSMHMTLLGTLLTLTPRVLFFGHHHGAADNAALQDIHLGGLLMLVGGGVAYLSGGLWLMFGLLRPAGRREAQ